MWHDEAGHKRFRLRNAYAGIALGIFWVAICVYELRFGLVIGLIVLLIIGGLWLIFSVFQLRSARRMNVAEPLPSGETGK
jgi:hypothetical protein